METFPTGYKTGTYNNFAELMNENDESYVRVEEKRPDGAAILERDV